MLRFTTFRFLERTLQHHFQKISPRPYDGRDVQSDRDVLGVDRSDTDIIQSNLSDRVE